MITVRAPALRKPSQPQQADRRARQERSNKKLSGGGQQNSHVCRKGLGALAKKTPVPRLQFCYFGLKTENNSQEHKFCCRSAVLATEMHCADVPRIITTTGPKC
jgi:hypothetical protein